MGDLANPWTAQHEGPMNGWTVLDPDWQRPICRRHYCTTEAVARRYARLLYRAWLQTLFGGKRAEEAAAQRKERDGG